MYKQGLNFTTQLRKGIMEYCFLILLEHKKAYPSELILWLKKYGLEVKEATVYTVLSRLSKEGKVEYQWVESLQGPPRKYFQATPYGRECLKIMTTVWDDLVNTVRALRQSMTIDSEFEHL